MENRSAGLRLLRKSKKSIFKLIFSRTGIIVLMLASNIALLCLFIFWFNDLFPHLYGASALFTVGMVLHLINSRMDPTSKITWLVVIMLLPVFGSLLYFFTRAELGHKAVKKKLEKIYKISEKSVIKSDASKNLQNKDAGVFALTQYVNKFTGIPVFDNTQCRYFSCGEEMWDQMCVELNKAEKSIYLEYFIIEEGEMWGQILDILAKKADQGVDVRVMYDGSCEFLLLPKSYPKKLASLGISCRVFAPVTPFVSTHYNYRDHRKIMTIDGKTAFTGGINLADEYINITHPFGHWKDTAVMLSGEAVKGFERMFLQIWSMEDKNISLPTEHFSPSKKSDAQGFVLPYYDDPLDNEQVGRQVYIDILNRAEKYVHIMTPYLILDEDLYSALTYAAKRNVEVILILPGVPDKKIPYALAKSHYSSLLEAGVKIYEYTPGFLHAKTVVSDSNEAVVGTINFDYRSLYHHFECAVYMYNTPCIEDIVKDFRETLEKSSQVTPKSIKKEKLFYKITGWLLKALSPLL